MSAHEIEIHGLLSHQLPIAESRARFKVIRAGRRFGKDAFAENVSLLGHGPQVERAEDIEPLWRGLVHGLDVVWLAPTIPQAGALWKNEVEPRFRNRERIAINKVEKTVSILKAEGSAYATLWVRSAEAIHSVRGIGKKLGGVVINEAAWMDLETVWRDVLRPTLMDCGGWAIIMSTTNGGPDGHQTEEGKRSPSFFNILCEQIQSGQRTLPEWQEFYGTARDNPRISPAEFESLVAEYPADDPRLAQEVFAKLIVGGAGVAFPEWSDEIHLTALEPERQTDAWRWAGGMDWGYTKPGWFGLFATSSERSVCRWEFYFKQTTPYQVGFNLGQSLKRFPRPEWIALDSACWAVTDGGPTIAEDLQRGLVDACGIKHAPPVISAPKGPGSRTAGKMLVHEALRFTRQPDGTVRPWDRPKLLVHGKDCPNLARTLPRLPRDPKGKDDVDTDAEDHPYDGLRYWQAARTPHVEREEAAAGPPDKHPGLSKGGVRRNRQEPEPVGGGRFQRYRPGAASGEYE